MKPTVYIETSVISCLTSMPSRDLIVAGHQQITAEWWEKDLPKFKALVSPVVFKEVSVGDSSAAERRLSAIKGMDVLTVSDEVRSLAVIYFETLRFSEAARTDALHMAVALWNGVDYLVTWNCRHIANGSVRKLIREINESRSIQTPVICTPEELLEF